MTLLRSISPPYVYLPALLRRQVHVPLPRAITLYHSELVANVLLYLCNGHQHLGLTVSLCEIEDLPLDVASLLSLGRRIAEFRLANYLMADSTIPRLFVVDEWPGKRRIRGSGARFVHKIANGEKTSVGIR